MCRFFHGEYFLVRLYRSKTLWTVLSPTAMPRASSVFQITCPHRPCFLRSFTMSASIDFGIAFGCVCGADESVGIPALPLYGARDPLRDGSWCDANVPCRFSNTPALQSNQVNRLHTNPREKWICGICHASKDTLFLLQVFPRCWDITTGLTKKLFKSIIYAFQQKCWSPDMGVRFRPIFRVFP